MTIAAARRARRITQRDAAEAIGTDQGTLSRWENDHATPSLPALIRTARLLDLDLHALADLLERAA